MKCEKHSSVFCTSASKDLYEQHYYYNTTETCIFAVCIAHLLSVSVIYLIVLRL